MVILWGRLIRLIEIGIMVVFGRDDVVMSSVVIIVLCREGTSLIIVVTIV